jgi:hypothetical protein
MEMVFVLVMLMLVPAAMVWVIARLWTVDARPRSGRLHF